MALNESSASLRVRRAAVLFFAVAGVALTARLGLWQWDRAAQKQALESSLAVRDAMPAVGAAEMAAVSDDRSELLYRRVRLHGRWLAERTVYLDNRQVDARPGFIVVTPLQWGDGAVLVQRGWVARDNDVRTRLPTLATPIGEVEVTGRIAPPPSRLYEFSSAASGAIRQNLDPSTYSREIGVALLPVSVLQIDGPIADGLLRKWPRPAVDIQKHYGYAFQWWALSALLAGLYVWYQLLRPRLASGR